MVLENAVFLFWCDDLPNRLFSVCRIQVLSECKYTNNLQHCIILIQNYKSNTTTSLIDPTSVIYSSIPANYFCFLLSFSASTLSSLNSNAFTEINISFTEIPNEITNSNKATPNV